MAIHRGGQNSKGTPGWYRRVLVTGPEENFRAWTGGMNEQGMNEQWASRSMSLRASLNLAAVSDQVSRVTVYYHRICAHTRALGHLATEASSS